MATAVELVRAEGLAKVTMRRLAQELDTGAASLYVYVRNTAELHAAVLDELLGVGGARADRGLAGDGLSWYCGRTRRCSSTTRVWRSPPWSRGPLVRTTSD